MKKISLFLLVTLSVFTFGSCSNSNNKDSVEHAEDMNEKKDSSNAVGAMDENDAEFMVEAANGGMMEVELGNLAQEKASNPAVKNFGAMMVRDHSKANEELKTLAAMKNVTLPSTVGEATQKHITDMREKSAKDFDKDYIDMMVNDHKDDISKFENIADKGKDAELRAWASTTLMTLRMHLDSANYVQNMMKDRK